MASNLSFNIDNPNPSDMNILQDNEAINRVIPPPQGSTSQ